MGAHFKVYQLGMGTLMTHGAEELAEWMKLHAVRQGDLADLLLVGQPKISSWLGGRKRPQPVDRAAIQRLTGIPEAHWLTHEEQQILGEKVARISRLARMKPRPDDVFTRLAGRVSVPKKGVIPMEKAAS